MRRQQLELRERMMDLVPGDQTNARARVEEQIGKDEVRFRARRDVVDAMWESKRGSQRDAMTQQTAAGAAKLEELKREMGLSAAPAAPAPARPAEQAQEAGQSDGAAGGA